jgi:hypothetical protein
LVLSGVEKNLECAFAHNAFCYFLVIGDCTVSQCEGTVNTLFMSRHLRINRRHIKDLHQKSLLNFYGFFFSNDLVTELCRFGAFQCPLDVAKGQ